MSFAQRRRLFLLLLGTPAVIYMVLIALWPLAQGIWYSLYDYNLLKPAQREFIWFDNYVALWADKSTRAAVINTFLFTTVAVAIEFVFGLALALLLWRDSLFNRVALALLLVPVTVTPLAVGLIFRALLAADFGLIGYYAAQWGISGPRGFFSEPVTAMGALILIDVWQFTPLVALILLAGLKALPTEVMDAAAVDGAGLWQRLRLVIVPMLLPVIFLALVLRTMDAFRVFDSVFITTKGGPNDATNVLQYHAVKQGLEFFNIGFASAMANLMLVCIALFAAGFIVLIRRTDKRINA